LLPLSNVPFPTTDRYFGVAFFFTGLSNTSGDIEMAMEMDSGSGWLSYEVLTFPKNAGASTLHIQLPGSYFMSSAPTATTLNFYIHSLDSNDTNVSYEIYIFDALYPALDADAIVDGKTVVQALRYLAAVACGESQGAGTGVEKYFGMDGSTERVRVTVDAQGNRTAVAYDPT
jgi:hypothetical protein